MVFIAIRYPSMADHISIRDVKFSRSPEGVKIVVTTDVPCVLYCRLTIHEPWIHKKPSLRRGVQFAEDVRFCFTVFEDNLQDEVGACLIHTFWKEDWPICTTKWCYFWGTIDGVACVSTSPFFKYHNVMEEMPMLKELSYYDSDLSAYDLVYGLYHWSTGFTSPIDCKLYFIIMRMTAYGVPPTTTVYIKHADALHKPVGPILAETDFDPTELTDWPRYLHKFIELPHIDLEAGREYRICLKCPEGSNPGGLVPWPKHDMFLRPEHQSRTWGSDDGGVTWWMGENNMGYDYDVYGFY